MHYLRIPKDRIGVLVGKSGNVKKEIEAKSGTKIEIDSENGDVVINEKENPIGMLKAVELIKAIGRGFSPEIAFKLLNDDIYFASIDIREYSKKSEKHLRRLKARIIGSEGKTKKLMQELTETDICIYGDTVSIIGDIDSLEIAKVAVDMILSGCEQSMVYNFLEKKRREKRLKELGGG
ncbi:MAG: KH domain-containing protein [Candidatus Thermoplasmatota archaeon]